MLPPRLMPHLTVAHAKAIEQHRKAHYHASQDHRLAQERCELLEEENKELRAADARREKALQDALKLLSLATRGKQEAQREATRHKREMRRAATRRMIARGPALPSAVQERLRVMQKRVEALETALHRKDRRCAFLGGVSNGARVARVRSKRSRSRTALNAPLAASWMLRCANSRIGALLIHRRRRRRRRAGGDRWPGTPTHESRNTYVSPRKSARKSVDPARVLSPR